MSATSSGADGAGLAVTVKDALPPSVTAEPPAMLTTGVGGGASSSTRRIRPSPLRMPVAVPAIPEAVSLGVPRLLRCGMLTLTVPSFASESSEAVSVSVATAALAPLAGPVNTTVLVAESNVTPMGLPDRDSVKSVPG
ncbi:MAG: hypothetical protein F4Y72_09150 [Gammaproteobacteria bacterium]|nr:hypothetical protein [Gammaproteobacteria bacterium]